MRTRIQAYERRSVHMYTCIYVHMYLCTHVYMYTCIYVHLYICTHVYMYTCIYVHMYICTHVYMYTCIYVHMYICTHVPMYTCTYVHMYLCTYICLYFFLSHSISQIARFLQDKSYLWIQYAHQMSRILKSAEIDFFLLRNEENREWSFPNREETRETVGIS